jgi:hypothetical protein
MTPAQLQILSDYIESQPDLSALPATPDGDVELAQLLNLNAAPNFAVWRSLVPLDQVSLAFDSAELDALSPVNRTRLQTLALYMTSGVQPAIPNVRAFFTTIFTTTTGPSTRAALNVVWARRATRVERIYATGTGTGADPGVLTYVGPVSPSDVNSARNLP